VPFHFEHLIGKSYYWIELHELVCVFLVYALVGYQKVHPILYLLFLFGVILFCILCYFLSFALLAFYPDDCYLL